MRDYVKNINSWKTVATIDFSRHNALAQYRKNKLVIYGISESVQVSDFESTVTTILLDTDVRCRIK